MEYIILTGSSKDQIEQRVESALIQGWKLVGGLSVVWDGKEKKYYQALAHL